MKKEWKKPELNNLAVEETKAIDGGHYHCVQCRRVLTDSERNLIDSEVLLN